MISLLVVSRQRTDLVLTSEIERGDVYSDLIRTDSHVPVSIKVRKGINNQSVKGVLF